MGLVKRRTETDLEKLWVEHNSRVVEEGLFFNQRFVLILLHFDFIKLHPPSPKRKKREERKLLTDRKIILFML